MKTTTTHPSTLAPLNLTHEEEALVDHLRRTGFTEDEIFCFICEDRERKEKYRIEDAMSDWSTNRY